LQVKTQEGKGINNPINWKYIWWACILFSQLQLVSQSADGETKKGELDKLFVVERILVHLLLREFGPFCCCRGNFGAFVVERI
jgi:hypothetical protein